MPWRTLCCLQHHLAWLSGGGSVMVWGGISLEGRTDLHLLVNSTFTTVRSRDYILRATVCGPWAPPGAIPGLMCPECVGSFWMTKALMPLTGPHVPHIWIQLRTSGTLYQSIHCIRASQATKEHQENVQELTDALIHVWQEMSQDILHLIRSMPKCCRECHTHYLLTLWVALRKFMQVQSAGNFSFLLWFSVAFWIQP